MKGLMTEFEGVKLNTLGPRARCWLAAYSEGDYGATYQQIKRMLITNRVRWYRRWGLSNNLPPAVGRPPGYQGTYLTGCLHNMIKDGYLEYHKTRKGPRGGYVYVVTKKCKIPRECVQFFYPEDNR